MQFYRCKCGDRQMWTTDGPRPCSGCEKCHTSYAQNPAEHTTPEPHCIRKRWNQDTGKPDGSLCMTCYERFDVMDTAAMIASGRAKWETSA